MWYDYGLIYGYRKCGKIFKQVYQECIVRHTAYFIYLIKQRGMYCWTNRF